MRNNEKDSIFKKLCEKATLKLNEYQKQIETATGKYQVVPVNRRDNDGEYLRFITRIRSRTGDCRVDHFKIYSEINSFLNSSP